jgi:hypothetical protein
MKSKFLILCNLLLISSLLYAQEKVAFFDWCVGSEGMNLAFMDMEVMPDQSVVALAYADGSTYGGTFLNANGAKANFQSTSGQAWMLIKFSPEGIVEWQKPVSERQGGIYQIEINEAGEIVVLAWVEEDEDEYYNYYEEEESESEEEPEFLGSIPAFGLERIKAGGYILKLSSTGQVSDTIFVDALEGLDLEDCQFKSYVDGKYLIAGTDAGEALPPKLAMKAGEYGSEYILAIGQEGELLWGDIMRYRKRHGYLVGGRALTYAPNGTVYLGGTYTKGGTFSNGKQTMVPVSYEESSRNSEWREVYIIAYTPPGKIKWIRTNEGSSFLSTLAATNQGLFVGHRTVKNILLGQSVDTTDKKQFGVSFINAKGKTIWTRMAGVNKAEEMIIDQKGNLRMLGTFRMHHNSGDIGRFSLPDRHQTFVATISPKGDILSLQSANLRVTTRNEPLIMALGANDEIYLSGVMWLSLPFKINRLDPSFPNLDASGDVAILGKVKLGVGLQKR